MEEIVKKEDKFIRTKGTRSVSIVAIENVFYVVANLIVSDAHFYLSLKK